MSHHLHICRWLRYGVMSGILMSWTHNAVCAVHHVCMVHDVGLLHCITGSRPIHKATPQGLPPNERPASRKPIFRTNIIIINDHILCIKWPDYPRCSKTCRANDIDERGSLAVLWLLMTAPAHINVRPLKMAPRQERTCHMWYVHTA
jgi:hypothetical protein